MESSSLSLLHTGITGMYHSVQLILSYVHHEQKILHLTLCSFFHPPFELEPLDVGAQLSAETF